MVEKGEVSLPPESILEQLKALPPEAQREVADFIAFLRHRGRKKARPKASTPLSKEPFVGMWRDREDMRDSSAWVREVRSREWSRRDG